MQTIKQPTASNPPTRPYDARVITSIGFAIVVGMLLLSVLSGYHTINRHNESLALMVRAAGVKTTLAYTMRESTQGRIDSLRRMARQIDPFDRDEEKMRFYAHAGKYLRARQILLQNLQTDRERQNIEHLDATAATVGGADARTLDALFDDHSPTSLVDDAVQESIDGHLASLGALDTMVRTIHRTTQDQIDSAGRDFHRTILVTMVTGIGAFTIAVGIAVFVFINARARSRWLSHHAAHDGLTDLLNRQAFEAALRLTLEHSAYSSAHHAVVMFDLDRFKLVNDSCGHPAGDALLKELSQELLACLRSADVLARIGGDEFGVLLRYTRPEDAETVAEKIRAAVEGFSFLHNSQTFHVQASIGLVSFGDQPVTLEELMSAADACCYSAKVEGGNRVHQPTTSFENTGRRSGEMRWVMRISDAIQNDGFVLFGQIIKPLHRELDDGRLTLEVLLRMRDEGGLGLIPPGQFLPAAERYGLVPDIDRWVVRHTLDWLAGLGKIAAQMRVNINICGTAASDPQFHSYVRECIHKTGVPPTSLCFEITESIAISNLANAAAFIDALRDLGCLFALDDFGSGLSSFNQLRNLKVDYLKIDGSFIQNVDRDPINRAMVESINAIGKKLGKRTVAEYVENDRIMRILQEIDVDFAQGFGLHKPEPLSNIEQTIVAADGEQGANDSIVA
ncbi:MAG: EAL domain-containing protein [Gammaproteobacteria bacterium]|nr:EAL domain-containing protein [Gammaproteobacteria bacterium]